MRTCAGERELGVVDLTRRQAGAERRRLHTGDCVGVGEDHFGRHAVGVHLLVALLGVERAAKTFFVLGLPVRDVVVVELHLQVAIGLALVEVRVELRVVPLLQVRPVLLAREARVRVGRDDRVAVVGFHQSPFPSTDRSS